MQWRFGISDTDAGTEAIASTPEVDPLVAEEQAFEKTLEDLTAGEGIDNSDYVLNRGDAAQLHNEL